ncbi:MAG: toprim domain-containing protein [Chloroflexi bacterium]|nr:toprim domain-containing protein [Chloroflexota bacterium]
MTAMIPIRYDVQALRRTRPLAAVITDYGIELRPSGRALVGRCPFHDDQGRPNLHVYAENQSWYCFRCAVGGDVIDFVRRRENLSFGEACRRLEERSPATVSPPPAPHPASPRERRWDRLTLEEQVVMNTACALYQHSLWREPRALAYVRGRGIPDWVIRQCALGFADGHSLEAYLRRRSGLRVAQDLGLLRKASGSGHASALPEFLAGRIVVPELRGGQCIWFIGRSIDDDAERPKYLALGGERPVLGMERAAGQREAFLCEGVFDYLTGVAWKLPAFSPCGTHLPAERLGFLARARVVYGVLDGDDPGRAAARRFAEQLGDRFQPLQLPDGCDLNDVSRQPEGQRNFFRLLAATRRQTRMEDTHEHAR